MSTRCNIVVIDAAGDKLIFYKHSDGYPEHTLPMLSALMERVKTGEIRDNTLQFSGWLIIAGREAQEADYTKWGERPKYMNWKVGYIEPTNEMHGDIEFIYTINLKDRTISVTDENGNFIDKQCYFCKKTIEGAPEDHTEHGEPYCSDCSGGLCERCGNYFGEHETPSGDYICQGCYESAVDKAHDSCDMER